MSEWLAWLLSHGALYSLSGFGVGVLVGMTGVGGGSLMTPLLILLFGIHPARAVGTDLLYAAATKSVGTGVHGMRKTIDWRITGRLAMGSIPATLVTIAWLQRFTTSGGALTRVVTPVLAATLALTAVCLLLRQPILAFASRRARAPRPATLMALTILAGAVLGVLVNLTSVGAGAIGMTALVLLYPQVPTVRLIGSDIAHAVPLTLLAGIGHWYLGTVDWSLLGALLVGSVPGIILGSYAAPRLPGFVLRPILAVTLLLVARQLMA